MAQGRDSYRRMFARHGMPATLVRLGTPNTEVSIHVVRRYSEEEQVVREISQYDARFTLRHEEVESSGFPLPIKKGDRIIKAGEYFTIRLSRPLESHGEVIGYEVRAIGG